MTLQVLVVQAQCSSKLLVSLQLKLMNLTVVNHELTFVVIFERFVSSVAGFKVSHFYIILYGIVLIISTV